MSTPLLVVLAVLIAPSLCAGQVPDSLPEGVTPEMIDVGAGLFGGQAICMACHGQDGTGMQGLGPDLTDDEWLHSDGSFDALVQQILQGIPASQSKSGVPMPPKGGAGITEEQVRAVAAYVWSFRYSSQG